MAQRAPVSRGGLLVMANAKKSMGCTKEGTNRLAACSIGLCNCMQVANWAPHLLCAREDCWEWRMTAVFMAQAIAVCGTLLACTPRIPCQLQEAAACFGLPCPHGYAGRPRHY